jgi:hypothetical protein
MVSRTSSSWFARHFQTRRWYDALLLCLVALAS